jgi:hypothetical protein
MRKDRIFITATVILRDENEISWNRDNPLREGGPTGETPASTPAVNPTTPSKETTPQLSPLSADAGVVEMTCHIRIDPKQMRTWKTERIAAFFSGLAQALAADRSGESDEE